MKYRLTFYVPSSDLVAVKEAVFAKGAGKFPGYDQCCWQTLGEGQFRPLAGSHPSIGQHGVLESLPEYKVELLCSAECIADVVCALKSAHPYEEPAYEVYRLEDF